MKKAAIVLIFSLVFIGCRKNELTSESEQFISTSFICTDTLGNVRTEFEPFEKFDLIFTMINKTGKDQSYRSTTPGSEIIISQGDSIVSSEFYGLVFPHVLLSGVLKSDSSTINRFRGPFNSLSSQSMLGPGSYVANVSMHLSFDSTTVEKPQDITLTIRGNFVIADKPNIYLYPLKACSLSVHLQFPSGGSVIQSIPSYGNGWNVLVDTTGKIDQKYDYLFYEGSTPDAYQYTTGWVVSKDTLASFFSNTLLQAGFSEREKNDFIEYWAPRLTDSSYDIVYPQFTADIEKVIRLNVSQTPDNMLRLFYVVHGTNGSSATLSQPIIPEFHRTGFVAAEWGVILK